MSVGKVIGSYGTFIALALPHTFRIGIWGIWWLWNVFQVAVILEAVILTGDYKHFGLHMISRHIQIRFRRCWTSFMSKAHGLIWQKHFVTKTNSPNWLEVNKAESRTSVVFGHLPSGPRPSLMVHAWQVVVFVDTHRAAYRLTTRETHLIQLISKVLTNVVRSTTVLNQPLFQLLILVVSGN